MRPFDRHLGVLWYQICAFLCALAAVTTFALGTNSYQLACVHQGAGNSRLFYRPRDRAAGFGSDRATLWPTGTMPALRYAYCPFGDEWHFTH
jgi:hypothetical protein